MRFNLNRLVFWNFLKHRTVTLRRQPVGGLGLSIKVRAPPPHPAPPPPRPFAPRFPRRSSPLSTLLSSRAAPSTESPLSSRRSSEATQVKTAAGPARARARGGGAGGAGGAAGAQGPPAAAPPCWQRGARGGVGSWLCPPRARCAQTLRDGEQRPARPGCEPLGHPPWTRCWPTPFMGKREILTK